MYFLENTKKIQEKVADGGGSAATKFREETPKKCVKHNPIQT